MKWITLIATIAYSCWLPYAHAQEISGQSIQLYTHFRSITGHPSWELLLRDPNTQKVFTYVFDITQLDNSWVILNESRNIRVIASLLHFFPYPKKIYNFCLLENRFLRGESLFIDVWGDVSPFRKTLQCNVMRYKI